MRYVSIILIALASVAIAFETSEDYSACIDTSNLSSVSIWTYPANGAYSIDRGDTIMLAVPKYNNAAPPEGFFEDGGGCVRLHGNTFWLEDSVSGPSPSDLWWYEIVEANAVDYDTIAVCKTDLESSVWTTWPSDTILDDDYLTNLLNSRNISCDTSDCDTCAFIIYWDSTQVRKDTLKLAYLRDYPPFFLVEWFFRVFVNDSNYYDTLFYVTESDSVFRPITSPVRITGESSTGTAKILGRRSAGMDVYSSKGKLVSADEDTEPSSGYPPFSVTWSGLSEGVNSIDVWGVNYEGVHTDTFTIVRNYHRTNRTIWRNR